MQELLKDCRFAGWLEVDPCATQLPAVCAVVFGIKPAADLWISSRLVPAFRSLAQKLELCFDIDLHFDRFDEASLRASRSHFGTTRAALATKPHSKTEAHIFIAKCAHALECAVASGWYPLVVENLLVEKSVADHVRFGRALGYPECCIAFFRRRNHWIYDNTPYAAWRNTCGVPSRFSNGLPRHTAFSLICHMPCSFACLESIEQSQEVVDAIRAEAPVYAEEIVRRLALPMLSLSELRLFIFEGRAAGEQRIKYTSVHPLNPTSHDDPLLHSLRAGDTCIIDGNILYFERCGTVVSTYFARGDRYGPECPFIVQAQ